jgi:hypothetical protein
MAKQTILKWAEKAPPYGGKHQKGRALYQQGIALLEEGFKDWEENGTREKNFGHFATVLTVMTVILAAAAGFTALPPGINRVVAAIVAFVAAVVGGLNGYINPDNKSTTARMLRAALIQLRDDVLRCLRRINDLADNGSTTDIEADLEHLEARRTSLKTMH